MSEFVEFETGKPVVLACPACGPVPAGAVAVECTSHAQQDDELVSYVSVGGGRYEPATEPAPVPEPVAHRMSWYVWAWNADGGHVKLRHTSTMRGTWGWDVECSCGWATNTGGATKGYVRDQVWLHKHDLA